MRKKYLLIAILVWVLLIAMGLYVYNKPHSSAAHARPDFSMKAADLYNQFQQDETAANIKYLDKIIEVKGTVTDVESSGTATTVELRDPSVAGGVSCSFMNADKNIQIPSKGSLVTIKGKCAGFLMDVNLVDCAIQE